MSATEGERLIPSSRPSALRAFGLVVALCATIRAPAPVRAGDAVELSRRIDARIEARLVQDRLVAAPAADDAEFLRRVTFDLLGSPPSPDDVRTFLSNPDPDKRARVIREHLANPRHAEHFAATWRDLLLPEADSDSQIRYFQPGFEAWLRERRRERAGFDAIVRELLAVPIAGSDQTPQMVLRDLKAPNPLAYLASKGGDPATIAASATRLFLGIRLECAQCHDHPFDSWTRTQFWNQAAFFAGIERRGRGPFAPLVEAQDRRRIPIADSEETVEAAFLDGTTPAPADAAAPRTALADWITSANNDRFSRAIVNRVWGQLMGAGFVDPVDDFSTGNSPSHRELLEELASEFAESQFDLDLLYTAICGSNAYQRTSRTTHDSQLAPQRFAKMAVKPLTGEQFFAALSQAIGYTPRTDRLGAGRDEDPIRRRVLNQFGTSGFYSDPETSVAQALVLMNGDLVNDAAAANSNSPLHSIRERSTEAGLEQLALLVWGRPPTSDELRVFSGHVDSGENSERERRLGDVLWIMLNSAEFRWNH